MSPFCCVGCCFLLWTFPLGWPGRKSDLMFPLFLLTIHRLPFVNSQLDAAMERISLLENVIKGHGLRVPWFPWWFSTLFWRLLGRGCEGGETVRLVLKPDIRAPIFAWECDWDGCIGVWGSRVEAGVLVNGGKGMEQGHNFFRLKVRSGEVNWCEVENALY